jgi:hypothetical protein
VVDHGQEILGAASRVKPSKKGIVAVPSAKEDSPNSSGSDITAAVTVPVKRGRGRPRKTQPLPEPDAGAEAEVEEEAVPVSPHRWRRLSKLFMLTISHPVRPAHACR